MQMRSQEHHVHTRDGFEGDANTIDGTCRVRARRTEAKKSRAERRPARALAENVTVDPGRICVGVSAYSTH
jgi:hypothetical protein